ncbi:MAG: hypothetical protein JMN27_03470 [gamma proteobacterium endosymbiont of Lamellibrachia anaximandri]|nr:hypothetical protein [gamma proteobacterium endosymbiont of Lamellibrachia anaximandri]MBL3532873.1 hypothetical protein [gamma proteobacterium endosymbiont of Lamellibrachia anaximandri]MBL3600936.1 hypothetical protein [gamma proteobacterium endosymbiont of Lamellibrachia anaximandri]
MAKVIIVDSSEGTRIPFLRGILTRSLSEAGLTFEQAYKLASNVRDDISNESEVTTLSLRQRVSKLLKKMGFSEVLENYENSDRGRVTIQVKDHLGQTNPFSISDHQRCLESTGLSAEKSASISQEIYQQLIDEGRYKIDSNDLGMLTYTELKNNFGAEAARRYMVWVDYTHSGRPLVLLFGGTTGCGKSTIATEVAHRLGIVRTQSTDMLREVMRMMIPKRLLPILHTSSFNAWRLLPGQSEQTEGTESQMISGYLNQTELLSVPCEAVIQRALRERVSLILEGIHVHPSLVGKISDNSDAVIVPIMLAVIKPDQLKRQLSGRGISAPARGSSQKYLSEFDSIWSLQSFLLSESDLSGIPIINNDDKDKATNRIMRTIIDALSENCDASVKSVFAQRSNKAV